MSENHIITDPAEVSISAVVIRANGNVEDLGVVGYWHKNPLRRALWKIKKNLAKD